MRLALQSIILNKNDSDRLFPRIDLALQRTTFGEDLIEAPGLRAPSCRIRDGCTR